MKCFHCGKQVRGEAILAPVNNPKVDQVFHPKCFVAYENAEAGRKYECPQCETTGEIIEIRYTAETHCDKSEEIKEKKPCPLCHGHGYTKDKYVPEMGQVGWKVKS